MTDLWSAIEPLLAGVERPSRYVDHEWNAVVDASSDYRVALMYPDTYEVGMANQALQILAERVRALDGCAAERVYVPWPDMASAMRAADVPLFTLESCMPLAECDLIGITLPYELTYTNICEALDLARIPLYAARRGDTDPLVIGGGPCAHNPEPVAPFFDAILIGDGEEALPEIVLAHRAARAGGLTRAQTLRTLADIEGVYVPALYAPGADGVLVPQAGAPARVRRRVLRDLDSVRSPVCPAVPYVDVVHDRVTVEVLRGCSRGCRFCQAGMVYRPVRERPADSVVRDALASLACTGYEEVSLTSLSTADHSQLEDILRRLSRRLEGTAVAVSVPSLRVDSFTLAIARLLGEGRKSGLTFAPEAGSQRLRDAINKNITEDDLLTTVRSAFGAGWRRVKLYFMIGLPTETDEDVAAIGALVACVHAAARESTPPSERGGIRIGVSVSTFVPKAHTPFQWEGQIPPSEVKRRQHILRDAMPHRGVDLSWHDADVSFLEAVLARGDRSVAAAIEEAWREGSVFDAWTEHYSLARWRRAFERTGLNPEERASAPFAFDAPLPWAHIDSGISESFLRAELENAREGVTTPDCTFEDCTGCGVCGACGADILLQAERGRRG